MEQQEELLELMPSIKEQKEIANRGFSSYRYKSYPVEGRGYGGINVCGLITGCGLVQMNGLYFFDKITKEQWLNVAKKIEQEYSTNTLIACLGDPYWGRCDKNIIDFGWVKAYDHWNKVHDYMQRIYLYEFKKDYK